MELIQTIMERHSIRKFLDKPVDKDILRRVLELGTHAASANNIQPWEIYVVTGERLEKLRETNVEDFRNDSAKDYCSTIPGDTQYKERARMIGKELFAKLDIPRDRYDLRKQWYEKGYRFFDAPVLFLLVMDKSLDETCFRLDIGCITQTICYAAMEYGLGTCVQEQAVNYHRGIREILGIPMNKQPIIGIALGYPDTNFPANSVVAPREPLEQITKWYD